MLFSPFFFWFIGEPWHTAPPKKIKYLVVVSGESHELRKDILSSQAPPGILNFI